MCRTLPLGALAGILLATGCTGNDPISKTTGNPVGADAGDIADNFACTDCLTDRDCQNGYICVQVGANSGCMPEPREASAKAAASSPSWWTTPASRRRSASIPTTSA